MESNTLHNKVFQLLCRKDFETPVDYNSATVLYCLLRRKGCFVMRKKVGEMQQLAIIQRYNHLDLFLICSCQYPSI